MLALGTGMMCQTAAGQGFVKIVPDSDILSGEAFCDSLLTRVAFPHAVSNLSNYPKINVAVLEAMQLLEDPNIEISRVYVCAGTSPAGLWGDNIKLAQARADNVARYIQTALDLPESKIIKESLIEDWDRLEAMVEASDMPHKAEVIEIINTKTWGDRKTALRTLAGGSVWRTLEKDFFPELRSARFGIFCRIKKPSIVTVVDTVYIRDTIYIKEYVREEPRVVSREPVKVEKTTPEKKVVAGKAPAGNPWHFGIKTNLVSDALAVPSFGIEFQMGRHISLNIMGKYSPFNIFVKDDNNTNIYGIYPQLRYWFSNNIMTKGAFVAIDGGATWYTLQWKDGLLYQNGKEGEYSSDAGNKAPAWKVGVSAGYSLGLGKKKAWGIEFETGVGYIHYDQNIGRFNEVSQKWEISDFQSKQHFGFTHACINLTYRFSTK